MSNCTITDRCGYWSAAGVFTGIESALVYAVPDLSSRRYDVSSTFRPLGVNPNITTLAYQLGRVATTDSTGEYTFALPYSATSAHPTSPTAQWTIVLPDGKMVTGTVPSVAGPLTLDDLVTTYSWTFANEIYVAPSTAGTLVRGTVAFSAAASSAVLFAAPFASSAYQILLTASTDSTTGGVVSVGWSSKSTSGFTINAADTFTGSVDFIAWL